MASADSFDHLLKELGIAIGIPDLCFDEEGFCHLVIDEHYALTLMKDHVTQRFIFMGQLAEGLPDPLTPEWVHYALTTALNPLKGDLPGIGLEPKSNTLVLYHGLALSALDLARLEQSLDLFIQQMKKWDSLNFLQSTSHFQPTTHYDLLKKI